MTERWAALRPQVPRDGAAEPWSSLEPLRSPFRVRGREIVSALGRRWAPLLVPQGFGPWQATARLSPPACALSALGAHRGGPFVCVLAAEAVAPPDAPGWRGCAASRGSR